MSRCYSHFTLADRRRLHQLLEREVPINEMARQLGRHRSTIYREIKRNTFHDRELPDYDGYYSTVAHDKRDHLFTHLKACVHVPLLDRGGCGSFLDPVHVDT